MDGEIDGFIEAYLTKKIAKGSSQPPAISDQSDDL
jgi:hypothetical protein